MDAQLAVKRDALTPAAERLAPCRRLLVLTGAGASADAGIPTFRGAGGVWRSHRPEDLASPDGFARNPELVWEWYRERRVQVARAQPHPGQRALALLARHFPAAEVLVATTNEDDLLERAGVAEVVHLHGSLFSTRCAGACGWEQAVDRDSELSRRSCPGCGAAVRPGSTWYGEPLPEAELERVLSFRADGCLLIGSSVLVAPVSNIPAEMALAGLPVVEVNCAETPFTSVATVSLRGPARDILPALVDLLTSPTVRDQRRRTAEG